MARSPLVVRKVYSTDAGDFTETTEFAVLHCANVTGNNNKFYCIEIQKNPKTGFFRLFTNYGRLEVSEVFEVRDENKAGEHLTEEMCKVEYDKLIKKKQKGKNVKRGAETIRETYTIVDVVSPTVGSSNIRNASEVSVKGTAPLVKTDDRDPESSRLIRAFVSENIHNITSNTTIKFTSRGFETSLGPVSEPHLDKADAALDEIRDQLNGDKSLDPKERDVRDSNSRYFSLIPRRFGSVISENDMILTPDKLAEEADLLNNLRTAVQAGLSDSDDNDQRVSIDISLLNSSDSFVRAITDRFESSKHRSHSGGAGQYRIRRVFSLNIPKVTSRYNAAISRYGEMSVRELFHGTKTANMLSISLNGLIIPPTGAAHVTGRMFGNGVYGASCSTKALNYATGFWGGSNNRGIAYVLIVKFAMGKEYVATSHQYGGAPAGYDSVWGKAGHSLINDEFIVYNLEQATITHILETEK